MPPRAIVLALDQLSRRCLGCYGHEWIETPNLDRLAACGTVFDQCFASPADEPPLRDATASCIEQLKRDGVSVRWLSEAAEPAVGDVEDLSKTSLAQLVNQAEQSLLELSQEPESPWLLWLESRGIGWPGLATTQFVELYADELDDVPADLMAFREIEVAYATLLTQFDHLLGRLLANIERLFGDAPPLLIVMATHGQPVGESDMLAPFVKPSSEFSSDANSFRDELVHPPLLISGATGETLGSRRSELVVPADVWPTLGDWFGISPTMSVDRDERSLLPLLQNSECVPRSELYLRDDEGGAAVRTGEFFFIQPEAAAQSDEGDSSGWLFLKPEDAWEVNDVATQYPDQVTKLRTALRDWLKTQPD
ncbi:MAG: sulfatase-like hydrolase/transferase [Planctomycetaceae bacterium]|nr:sulfatase-like hydrolase/transferase [Planctomycetaceae bacterium]